MLFSRIWPRKVDIVVEVFIDEASVVGGDDIICEARLPPFVVDSGSREAKFFFVKGAGFRFRAFFVSFVGFVRFSGIPMPERSEEVGKINKMSCSCSKL